MKTINILHLEDNPDDANLIQTLIKRTDLNSNIMWVDTKEKFETALIKSEFELILGDYSVPNYSGLAALKYSKEKKPDIPFILLSGTIGEEKTIELFEAGATDFITKNNLQRLVPAITRTLNEIEEKTKRFVAEEAYRKNDELFRQFAENIKEVFWRMTPEMDQLTYVSPAYDEIWGQPREKLYSNPYEWMEPIIEADKDKVKLFLDQISKQKTATVEYRIVRPDGIIKIIFVKAFQVRDEQGKLINIIGIAADMTEFTQLKAQAHLNDKLTTVGTLAAGIAHEINNPIAWILGNLTFIKKNKTKFDLIKLEEVVDESIQGAKRIRDIVKNLKEFARVDETEITLVDLHHILDSVLIIASAEIKLRAHVVTEYAKNLPSIEGNSGQLHQVFLNLAMNAVQAIPEGDIENNTIRIVTAQENGYVRVDVTDTGSGIQPENLAKIFDPFFTTKKIGNGSGLGLSISHGIVEKLGGNITVKSAPGNGSTFSVYLPLIQKTRIKSDKKPPKTVVIPTSTRKRILVVDDEPYLLKSIQRMLEDQHDITTASSGQAALDILKNEKQYDLIISDLSMPNISGADLYHFIAEKFPGLENHIIFMTGGAYTANLKEFISSVNNARLIKPFEQEELLRLIESVRVNQ